MMSSSVRLSCSRRRRAAMPADISSFKNFSWHRKGAHRRTPLSLRMRVPFLKVPVERYELIGRGSTPVLTISQERCSFTHTSGSGSCR